MDSSLVCTSAYDGYVRLWDFFRSSCVKTLITETGSTSAVSCLKLIGENLLIGNMNGSLGLYDLKGALLKSYTGHKNRQLCLEINHFAYNGRDCLIGGSECGSVCVWDIQSQKLIKRRKMSN